MGRIRLTNNAAERALRGIALGRKSWLFAGSDRGGERAAAMYSLTVTAKLNDVDPKAWLADGLARIGDHPATRLDELLPWNWARLTHRPAKPPRPEPSDRARRPDTEQEAGRASIWQVERDTGQHRIFASRLRKPVGLPWEPQTGVLWTVVNERDELGSDLVPDYMMSVRDGGFLRLALQLFWPTSRQSHEAATA